MCWSECDRETLIRRRSWLIKGCCAVGEKVFNDLFRICYNSKAYDFIQTFCKNTGHFIMFCMITNVYNKKTKGPTLM
jgi:hypothetical protein